MAIIAFVTEPTQAVRVVERAILFESGQMQEGLKSYTEAVGLEQPQHA